MPIIKDCRLSVVDLFNVMAIFTPENQEKKMQTEMLQKQTFYLTNILNFSRQNSYHSQTNRQQRVHLLQAVENPIR